MLAMQNKTAGGAGITNAWVLRVNERSNISITNYIYYELVMM